MRGKFKPKSDDTGHQWAFIRIDFAVDHGSIMSILADWAMLGYGDGPDLSTARIHEIVRDEFAAHGAVGGEQDGLLVPTEAVRAWARRQADRVWPVGGV